jgi:hypothetical protein
MKRMKNVFVAVTAAACLLTSALTALPASANGGLREIKGDVNLDGRVDVTDLSILSTRVADHYNFYYVSGTPKYNSDVDDNGHIDIMDVITLRSFISSGNPTQAGINAARGAMKGDVNVDGKIDVTDLTMLKLGSYRSGTQKYNADLDNNGKIDYFDEYSLTRWIVNPY